MPVWDETILWWLAAVSVVSFVGSLLAVPIIVVRIPRDYFSMPRRKADSWGHRNMIARSVVVLFKNVLGCLLVLAGLAMLVLPGQGLLTLFTGLLLMDFPGKYRLERFLISREPVGRGINWIRRRWGVAPLVVSDDVKL